MFFQEESANWSDGEEKEASENSQATTAAYVTPASSFTSSVSGEIMCENSQATTAVYVTPASSLTSSVSDEIMCGYFVGYDGETPHLMRFNSETGSVSDEGTCKELSDDSEDDMADARKDNPNDDSHDNHHGGGRVQIKDKKEK